MNRVFSLFEIKAKSLLQILHLLPFMQLMESPQPFFFIRWLKLTYIAEIYKLLIEQFLQKDKIALAIGYELE